MTKANDPTVVSGEPVPRTVTKLGRYTLKQRLGVGGMAEVYLAEQDGPRAFTKKVVIKRILPSLAQDAGFVAMFVREAQVAARLTHTNVVQIYELGEQKNDDGSVEYFIAMEYIDGLTLQRLASASWQKGGAVPVDVVLRTCADAARGLHAAHTLADDDGKRLGLVHRDISPDNLMVSKDGVTKVLDFGIAKGPELEGPKTRTGQLRGKVPYMAPEQIQGHALDGRCDLWALGVSMYWLLCGERPFDRGTDYHTMAAILSDAPRAPRSINPGIPEALERIILHLLEKDPARRPASGADVADALEELTAAGTATGRKSTVAFVERFVHGAAPVGNPLSEAGDKTSNTRPLGGKSAVEGAAVASTGAATGAATGAQAPRQVTLPQEAPVVTEDVSSPNPVSQPGVPQGAQRVALDDLDPHDPRTAVAADALPAAPPRSAEQLPTGVAPSLAGAIRTEAPPRAAGAAGNHPVVDMLAPPRDKSPLPALLAIGGIVLFLGAGAFGLYRFLQGRDDGGAAADAGALAANPAIDAATDAGALAALPVDAGGTATGTAAGAAPVDAGAAVVAAVVADAGEARSTDAGAAVALVEDAVVDAGVAKPDPPPLPTRISVKAKAPARIDWRSESGALLGRGSTTLSLPRGTARVVAADPSRRTEHLLPVTGGKVDYGSLPTATLVVKPVDGTKVFIERDWIQETEAAVVAGTYEVRVTRGTKILSRKSVAFKAGQTVTIDAAKP